MADEGEPIADLDTRVIPEAHLHFHWRAFNRLSTDRPVAFGAGPIPWTAIDRYAERHHLADPDEYERFETLIRAMDRAFLDWNAEQQA